MRTNAPTSRRRKPARPATDIPPAVQARVAEIIRDGQPLNWFLVSDDELAALERGEVPSRTRELAHLLLTDPLRIETEDR